ncbi:terminase small subunit [Pectobacterium aroidearum]|uniref:terminase small subunit n=1 Tax=Pectobacterium aroidearum TaxID=1201031 RepID=UPI0032EE7DD0
MAKPDWGELQNQFLVEHASTGISPKDWCDTQGLNYESARRYIKKPTAHKEKSAQKSAQRKLRTAQAEKSADDLLKTKKLSPQKKQFVAEYLIDQNATAAAGRAGYSDPNYGRQLIADPNVAEAIAQQQKASIARTLVSADDVLDKMWQLATFDANEISQYRRGACRFCWGFGHHYQWRDSVEFEERTAEARQKKGKEPSDNGGYGYDHNREPNCDCPRCNGDGIGRPHFTDTRNLTGIARLAYSGTKVVKGGVEISAISREKMFEAVMRRTGLTDSELAQKLLEMELKKRTAEAERAEQEVAAKRKGSNGDDKPTIVIKLVNSPDAD